QAHMPSEFSQRITQIHAAQRNFLVAESHHLDARVCDGRIIDGHGDLRPEHVYLQHRPMIIDCLEFSASLRQVDALDDLSFLAMECDRLGREDVGEGVIAAYAAAAGDAAPRRLCTFYKSHRACVRAKVAAMSRQFGADRAERLAEAIAYLEQAERYLSDLRQPILLVLSNVGHSLNNDLAAAIAQKLDATLLETHREADLPAAARRASDVLAASEICQRCRKLLAQGRSVVLSGEQGLDGLISDVASMARQSGAVAMAVVSSALEENVKKGPAVNGNGAAAGEPRDAWPLLSRMVVSPTASVEESARQVFLELGRHSVR
ncbi:MAG: hypothetical protein AAF961_14020, partial [Planctomycetota bacterium]